MMIIIIGQCLTIAVVAIALYSRADSNAGMCEISDSNTLQIIYDLHLNVLRLTIFRFRQSNHDVHLTRATTAFATHVWTAVIKVIQLCNA